MLRVLLTSALLLGACACADQPEKEAAPQAPAKELATPVFPVDDWPWWRGPANNGVAQPKQTPPLRWSDTENVLWKTAIPGRGHGSPIVVGDQVLLAIAEPDKGTQSVVCFERDTGKQLWRTDVHKGGLTKAGNAKSSLASSTPACDGERIFINFLNGEAIWATALDRSGKQLWQTKITDFAIHQGFAASPAIYRSLVLVSADSRGKGSLVAGLDRVTGEILWKRPRPKLANYASPIVLNVAGRDQLLLQGCELVTSLEPTTGKTLWEIPGSTTECVTSTPSDGVHIFTSGGYPKNHIAAVRADGSGKVAWENKSRVYVPSMLVAGDSLYGIQDGGIAFCLKSDTGAERWKERLDGTFSSSPVLVGDLIFATNESGRTFIYKADPAKFDLVAENQLGDNVLSTPAICGSRIFTRVAFQQGGRRQEMLYCLAAKSK